MTTTRSITNTYLKCLRPKSTAYDIPDEKAGPLTIRVRASGAVVFVYRGRVGGRQVKEVFGRWGGAVVHTDAPANHPEDGLPILSLEEARAVSFDMKAKAKVALPRPKPHPHYQVRSTKLTLAMAHEEYCREYVRDRPSAGNESLTRKWVLPAFGDRAVKTLTRRELNAHFEGLREHFRRMDEDGNEYTGAGLNTVLRTFKPLLTWCVRRDYIEHNPATTIEMKAEDRVRNRVLRAHELGWVLMSLASEERMAAPLQLLLRTGCRLSDITKLTWGEVQFEDGVPVKLLKHTTKAKVPHVAYLTEQARRLLPPRPKTASSKDLVFPDALRTRGSSILDRLRGRVQDLAGPLEHVAHWTIHDFRRSLTTNLSEMREEGKLTYADAAEDYVLAHIPTGVTRKHYNHAKHYKDRERMLTVWSDYLDKCLSNVQQRCEQGGHVEMQEVA
ncbi:tyrosine-type recombinase/integrase [Novosphingobium mangrovi (ex Hu et al. 2023)]|uniref:Integrase family protein n=1 Tax=Novosphingobium mangrovi (ex Hu et al. 2023) TaxID=2930094 RepID=A0ABT0AAH6_9SPHN|nr:tyrosine-type recombinase/integrase [Novosphingobium mangrovi (ex Hu et al. 2023)]MCJ1960184.1 integrase family protein [Novosphingobium mangrovi (ex Hu et al. 2023)]